MLVGALPADAAPRGGDTSGAPQWWRASDNGPRSPRAVDTRRPGPRVGTPALVVGDRVRGARLNAIVSAAPR